MSCNSLPGSGGQLIIPRYAGAPVFDSLTAPCGSGSCASDYFGLKVFHQVYGAKVLTWDLSLSAALRAYSGPLESKVQVGRTAASDAANWTDLTSFAADTGVYSDDAQRVFSAESNLHYRVLVRLANGTLLASQAVRAQDSLPTRLLPTFNEILRRWQRQARSGELRSGFLLKRRRWGARCPTCLDRDGGQKIKSDCPTCYDTGFDGGFFQPIGCSYAQVGEYSFDEKFEDQLGYSVDGYVAPLLMLNLPSIYPGDVWVEYETDHRWSLGRVESKVRVGTVETIVRITAGRISADNITYTFPVARG